LGLSYRKPENALENCTMKTCTSFRSTQYFRVIKLRKVKGAGYLVHIGEKRNLYRIVVEKHEGKKQVGKPSCRYEGNKRIDVKDMGCQSVY